MRTAFVISPIMILLLISACSSKRVLPTEEQRREARQQMSCIVILPVETELHGDPPITFDKASDLEKGAAYMDMVLTDQLVGRSHVRVLSERQVTSLIPIDTATREALFEKVGSALNCSGVMVTTLKDFQQRVGGSYGVDAPASLSFTMKLFDTASSRMVWSGMFSETQQSLFSNIMSFSTAQNRGFKWITVEELVDQGIREKIEECPYL